jgi:hypothetical protein
MHILNNKYDFGTSEETLKILKPCHKGPRMNCWETFYVQLFHQHGTKINEQHLNDINPLYEIADSHESPYTLRNSVTNCTAHSTHYNLVSPTNQYVYILFAYLRFGFLTSRNAEKQVATILKNV